MSNGAKSPQPPVKEQRNLKPGALTNVDRPASNGFAGYSTEEGLDVSAHGRLRLLKVISSRIFLACRSETPRHGICIAM
jgi:hypothetical protein